MMDASVIYSDDVFYFTFNYFAIALLFCNFNYLLNYNIIYMNFNYSIIYYGPINIANLCLPNGPKNVEYSWFIIIKIFTIRIEY